MGQGIAGDAHAGPFVRHRYLARRNPRAANLRQVHLFPSETLEAVRLVGYDVAPGNLGENITTLGLALEELPLGTELRVGATARLQLTGLRTPCILIDRYRDGLKQHLLEGRGVVAYRAGVMAIATRSGAISSGDRIEVLLPPAPLSPLPPI